METIKTKKNLRLTVDHHLEECVKKKIVVDIDIEGKDEQGKIDLAKLRAGGFIKQRQKDKFTVRLQCPAGRMSVKHLKKVADVAEKFGGEYVHFSTRQSLEIPYVNYKDFGPLVDGLKEVGQKVASCGPRVRVPTACGGCVYNPNGLTDTIKLADIVNDKFFGLRTNHKVKISFSACPSDCIRTNTADIGFQGVVFPKWNEENCTGCTICASACAEGAIEPDPKTGKPIFCSAKCLYCADCVRSCPTFSWQEEKTGHLVRVGGKHGRHPLNGAVVAKFVTDEEVPAVIDTTIKWYHRAGKGKGRVRLGNLLREDGSMKDYMNALGEALGDDRLVENPDPPEKIVTNR